jgi:hypothetical protein
VHSEHKLPQAWHDRREPTPTCSLRTVAQRSMSSNIIGPERAEHEASRVTQFLPHVHRLESTTILEETRVRQRRDRLGRRDGHSSRACMSIFAVAINCVVSVERS